MTVKTKSRLPLAALAAVLALSAAPAAFADPDGLRGDPRARGDVRFEHPTSAPQSWRDDDRRRSHDHRDVRPDYRNPNAYVNFSFRERFVRIEHWINRSVERGSLTRREARWVWRQLEDTRAIAISYRRSQDAYTVWEADEIDARLDRIRNQIRGENRDGQWSSWRNDDWRGRSGAVSF